MRQKDLFHNMKHKTHFLKLFKQILIIIAALSLSCLPECFAVEGKKTGVIDNSHQPGDRFEISRYAGKKLVLFLYSMDDPRVETVIKLMNDLHKIRREYNFDVVGISLDIDRLPEVERFNQARDVSLSH